MTGERYWWPAGHTDSLTGVTWKAPPDPFAGLPWSLLHEQNKNMSDSLFDAWLFEFLQKIREDSEAWHTLLFHMKEHSEVREVSVMWRWLDAMEQGGSCPPVPLCSAPKAATKVPEAVAEAPEAATKAPEATAAASVPPPGADHVVQTPEATGSSSVLTNNNAPYRTLRNVPVRQAMDEMNMAKRAVELSERSAQPSPQKRRKAPEPRCLAIWGDDEGNRPESKFEGFACFDGPKTEDGQATCDFGEALRVSSSDLGPVFDEENTHLPSAQRKTLQSIARIILGSEQEFERVTESIVKGFRHRLGQQGGSCDIDINFKTLWVVLKTGENEGKWINGTSPSNIQLVKTSLENIDTLAVLKKNEVSGP